MLGSGILDVVIGLALVFFLVSVVCTAVREAFESALKHRAAYLEFAIRELLNDKSGTGIAKQLYEHPLINGLFSGNYNPGPFDRPRLLALGRNLPSYIPAKNFAAALMSIVLRGDDMKESPRYEKLTLTSLRRAVQDLENPYIQHAFMSAIDVGENDLDAVRKQLENWFDAAMDRVSGWYKRTTQAFIFGIAFVVVALLNVNAIAIANSLYRDQNLRQTVVVAASEIKSANVPAQASLAKLEGLKLPIGWHANSFSKWMSRWNPAEGERGIDAWTDIVTPLLGLLFSAFAATLGAPFWFDVLNKVMVIRGTVKPHEKSPEEGSEDRQTEVAAPPPAVVHIVSGLPVSQASASAVNDNDDHDCAIGEDNPTPDVALPQSTGGVG